MTQEMLIKSALLKDFGINEPIVIQNIDSEKYYGVSKVQFRKILAYLCADDKISRAKSGIYYFPAYNPLLNKKTPLSEQKIIQAKFIRSKNEVYGYQTGLSFANNLGLTTQVPQVIEIASNKVAKNKVEKLTASFNIYKAKVTVTEENYKILQIFDVLNDYNDQIEVTNKTFLKIVSQYLADVTIPDEMFNQIIDRYPNNVLKNIFKRHLSTIIEKN